VVVTGAGADEVTAALAERRRRFAPIVVLVVVPAHRADTASHRGRGVVVISGRTAAETVSAWNHLVLSGVGR
jgi:hypothetical protein